jgi:hypothetical protein
VFSGQCPIQVAVRGWNAAALAGYDPEGDKQPAKQGISV